MDPNDPFGSMLPIAYDMGSSLPQNADPSLGTDVYLPSGLEHFEAGQNPTIFMGDAFGGRTLAAVPGSPQYENYKRMLQRGDYQAALKLAALVGGGALAGSMLGPASGVTTASESFEASPLTAVAGESTFLPEAGAGAAGASGGLDALAAEAGVAPGTALTTALPEASAVADFGVGPGVASQGFWGSLGDAAKSLVTNPNGGYNWGNIIKLGGMGLSGLQALFNHPKQAQQPGLPAWMTQPLQVPNFKRTQNPMPQNDYYTYGQTGGEHQFFTGDRMTPLGQASAPQQTPMMHISDPNQAHAFVSGGHVAGPGTGRSDDIDAKLSNGEYVMDAETVSLLGDGSTEAGAKRLDELRSNLRKHKGSNLARGKFSKDAKPPLDYIPSLRKLRKAKGGSLSVIRGGIPKLSPEEAAAKLALMKRMIAAYEEAQKRPPLSLETPVPPKDLGADPYNRDPTKKAEGGKVKAVDALDDLADKLERAIGLGDENSQSILERQIEALQPGFKAELAKGGSIAAIIEKLRLGPRIGAAKNYSEKTELRDALSKINPSSPLLRDSTRTAPVPGGVRQQQGTILEGDDLMKQLLGDR